MKRPLQTKSTKKCYCIVVPFVSFVHLSMSKEMLYDFFTIHNGIKAFLLYFVAFWVRVIIKKSHREVSSVEQDTIDCEYLSQKNLKKKIKNKKIISLHSTVQPQPSMAKKFFWTSCLFLKNSGYFMM